MAGLEGQSSYRPIDACGIIGNLQSVALVSMDGVIDWCCLPRFDSPSVFGGILDRHKAGHFQIAPVAAGSNRQMYLPETNVLMTRFPREEGMCEVVDFMPVCKEALPPGEMGPSEIVRVVRGVRGSMRMRLDCFPAFDYARAGCGRVEVHDWGAVIVSEAGCLTLRSPVGLSLEDGHLVAQFPVAAKEAYTFSLRFFDRWDGSVPAPVDGLALMEAEVRYWRNWVNRCTYTGRWREKILRSALALKLLTYHPTGAIVAAATCSLPEEIGGVRNWDYRYTWIRDAAFTVFTFLRMGFQEEATAFMGWLEKRAHELERVNGPLNVMYAIDGRHDLTESHLDHLEGYRESKPVRIGNGAYSQLQLDIYGELIDSIYLHDKHVMPISYSLWKRVKTMLEWVAANWHQPDEGLWEVRSGRQHFVYSKLQCWVALDRGLRLASRRSLPLDRVKLEEQRDRIFEWIMREGWDEELQSFVQAAGSKTLDAANLLMPMVYFISPQDSRMLRTLERTMEELVSDSLVYRYQLHGEQAANDGLDGGEGTFSMCTFWLVEALAKAGRLDEARVIFEKMLTYCNHLGLYSEEISPTGMALGNFPQAFTHLGLVSAALYLNSRLDEEKN